MRIWKLLRKIAGADSHTRRMKAIFRVRSIRDELHHIVGQSIWDTEFDEQRKRYQQDIDDLLKRLEADLTCHNWWGDQERTLAAQRAAKRLELPLSKS